MGCYAGIDIGAISAKASLILDKADLDACGAPQGWELFNADANGDARIYLSPYRRTRGKPLAAATELLDEIISAVGADRVAGVTFTGSAAKLAAEKLSAAEVNEFRAIAAGLTAMGIEARTVFEMGGETSKYMRLSAGDEGYGIVDYSTNGDCAAGTGSFIDQQAGRLKYNVEELGEICLSAERAAAVAGRCSVFAKSDMIHAQQKGYTPAEVLRGLCLAVARNFRTAVVRSHPVEPPVAFLGGLAANSAVVRALREASGLDEKQLFVPRGFAHVPAVGAAALAAKAGASAGLAHMKKLRAASDSAHGAFPTTNPLTMDRVVLLRDRVEPYEAPYGDGPIDAYLGIDIGSVSTNLVLIDEEGRMMHEIYVRTQGRPIEVVGEGLREIRRAWGRRARIRGVGTTGSGRELIGQLVGADTVNDEITAHKTGATFLGRTMLDGRVPDTIFEIGGQDSKYISLQDGVVVDFTMNEACAAGTGSFLEERAEELEIAIKGQFAELALSSRAPVRLGERCTVFMERDVNSYLQRGAEKADLVAGLAYSVVYNYINRVVRGRPIGRTVFFQGGTAYNDAVAAAFAEVCGREIIVPPHNGVIGAIGAALLAREVMSAPARQGNAEPSRRGDDSGAYVSDFADKPFENENPQSAIRNPKFLSRFRGYDISRVNYALREFTCKGCSNACAIQEFTVEGEKTYWGDKCSDRFRKAAKAAIRPVIPDLMEMRSAWLMDESRLAAPRSDAPTVGIPLTMFALQSLPFWRTLLTELGARVTLSEPTNRKIIQAGLDSAVAEPCFPIIVAHGHVLSLLDRDDVDYVLAPNIISQQTRWMNTESHLCPWHQTLPFVVRRAPRVEERAGRLLTPTVRFRQGRENVRREMEQFLLAHALGRRLKLRRAKIASAVSAAFAAQDEFAAKCLAAGRDAMDTLRRTGAPGIVLLGRPYNVHDAGVNLSVARKLRDHYGVNCVPLDFLDTDPVDVRGMNDNMFWNLGRQILAAARIVAEHPNLHIVHITNFKCGPDSFLKHYIRPASGKPFLTLQFDGHSNDAGIMTRCEAYLDSKGILRPRREELVSAPA